MRTSAVLGLFFAASLATADVRAEPVIVTSTTFTTEGIFTCWAALCSGTGTNSLTLGSGDQTATLTFMGRSETLTVWNTTMPVLLAQISGTASDGFTFPPSPHPAQPVFGLSIKMTQSSPVGDSQTRFFQFGPGGTTMANLFRAYDSYFAFDTGRDDYPVIVYSINPWPFGIAADGITNVTADVGAAPEPATLVLLGTGLAGVVAARRRKKQSQSERPIRS